MASAISGDHIVPLADWLTLYQDLMLVSGPCSVESRRQLVGTARQLAATGKVSLLRAGVWKPRSLPGQFEGRGAEALPWLQEIKKETGLPVAVEVARPSHAELCLKHDVDVIWLGARTTVNPFMVQEIANAIKGTGLPVMIKNPVCPDLRLWIGAIERIMLAGSQKIVAIHRGFQTHEKKIYRNIPLWDIPMALKNKMPLLPVICDPSHIAGDVQWIRELAEKSLAMKMNGLMIETHYRPEDALTDPLQQMTPAAYHELVNKLPDNVAMQADTPDRLENLRGQIDDYDHRLLELLACRLSLSKQAGKVKKQQGVEILQPRRQQNLFHDRHIKAKTLGLCPVFVKDFMTLLHEQSVLVQSEDAANDKKP